MPTQHVHRLIIVVPVAKVAAVVAWLQTNIGANCVPSDLGPGLNASGLAADAATFRWCCASFTELECREILKRLCVLASVTGPTNPQWTSWTGAQKRSWLASVQAAVLSGFGVYVRLADNVGAWDNASALLTAGGLKRIA